MGVGKDMKTFFAAMNEQVGMGGYGAKIKMTPMGPFRWNDAVQLWENVNNGMTMNNVSFQDMFISDYETNSGDNGSAGISAIILTPSDWGGLGGLDTAATLYWAGDPSPDTDINGATVRNVTFSNVSGSISVSLTYTGIFGNAPANIRYSKNGNPPVTYTVPISIANGDTLKIGATTGGGVGPDSGTITVTNVTTSTVLGTIAYTYSG
jgi:hypothetical protein